MGWSQLGDGATGIYSVEGRDAAKYPSMHRTAPTIKNYLAPNVSSMEVEKPWAKASKVCNELSSG